MDLLAGVISVVVCLIGAGLAIAMGAVIPGIERKVQARIQQRIGPPILTPGFWSWLKFAYKWPIKPWATIPRFYESIIALGVVIVIFALLITLPPFWGVLGVASILGIAGLLKLEELIYVLAGSVSQSFLSVPFLRHDLAKGGAKLGFRREYFEQQAAFRALKMAAICSIPLYIALAVPFAVAKSPFIADVISIQNPAFFLGGILPLPSKPIFLTVPGFIATIVYFAGYVMLLNEKPFNIVKPKVDLIEGVFLEYAAKYRTYMYMLIHIFTFVLSSIFVTLFLGIPLDPTKPALLALHLALTLPLPVLKAVLAAFSPVLTFRQLYPASMGFTALAAFSLVLALIL